MAKSCKFNNAGRQTICSLPELPRDYDKFAGISPSTKTFSIARNRSKKDNFRGGRTPFIADGGELLF